MLLLILCCCCCCCCCWGSQYKNNNNKLGSGNLGRPLFKLIQNAKGLFPLLLRVSTQRNAQP